MYSLREAFAFFVKLFKFLEDKTSEDLWNSFKEALYLMTINYEER
jgi:hypothetical protein